VVKSLKVGIRLAAENRGYVEQSFGNSTAARLLRSQFRPRITLFLGKEGPSSTLNDWLSFGSSTETLRAQDLLH